MMEKLVSLLENKDRKYIIDESKTFKYRSIVGSYDHILKTYQLRGRISQISGADYEDLIERILAYNLSHIRVHSIIGEDESTLIFTDEEVEVLIKVLHLKRKASF
ncbi:hypothetical protein [Fulvivirga ligni]|uniref:hypothetical protein n=1 Tax=Fulvivirga ligni TaxID=2904246 RepID=UPI001F17FE1D|nr:hypothetical protein [Fulvivirga ligni]UII20225.1 hypothetical protein LVD16_20475 [Fulvivirga ligni]